MSEARAPNRTLDLAELERPEYRRVLGRLDVLLAGEAGAYLHPSKRWEYPWAIERAGLGSGARVLDAGAGQSIFPVYLADAGLAVTALDRAPPLRLGADQGLAIDYVCGDLTELPLATECFDAVFCISVIEHLSDDGVGAALRELHRVLRPSGRLLLTTDFYEDAGAEIWYRGPDRHFRVDWNVFDRGRLERRLLAAPGFRVDGAVDLGVDWVSVRERMLHFHGYPYTSVGIALIRI